LALKNVLDNPTVKNSTLVELRGTKKKQKGLFPRFSRGKLMSVTSSSHQGKNLYARKPGKSLRGEKGVLRPVALFKKHLRKKLKSLIIVRTMLEDSGTSLGKGGG